jgi:hypothetical protein
MASVAQAAAGGKPVLVIEFAAHLAVQSGTLAYTGVFDEQRGAMMANDTKNDDGSPKFGKLLLVLVGAVVFCGVLTWVMGTYFPHFPS